MKQTGASYYDTAIDFKMNNSALIANQKLKVGIERLKKKQKGRPPMSVKRKTKSLK